MLFVLKNFSFLYSIEFIRIPYNAVKNAVFKALNLFLNRKHQVSAVSEATLANVLIFFYSPMEKKSNDVIFFILFVKSGY
ncbi:MAG: hypothetical protein WCS96_09805 [Victivallales bacterium]|jgi:hypothetical protein